MTNLKWLLWKDYRHNRLIVVAGLLLLLVPYLVGFGVILWAAFVPMGEHDGVAVYWTPSLPKVAIGASFYSLVLSELTFALIGGNSIAGERADRASEFLFSLPLSRKAILASKLLFASLIAGTVWLINGTVFFSVASALGECPRVEDCGMSILTLVVVGLVFFCVAWFLSSLTASPTFAVCGGVITPFLMGAGLNVAQWALVNTRVIEGPMRDLSQPAMLRLLLALYFVVALICFTAGTWLYLRRVEP